MCWRWLWSPGKARTGGGIVYTETQTSRYCHTAGNIGERRNQSFHMIACLSHFHQRIYLTTSLMRNTCTRVFVTISFQTSNSSLTHETQLIFQTTTHKTWTIHFVWHLHKFRPYASWQVPQRSFHLSQWALRVWGKQVAVSRASPDQASVRRRGSDSSQTSTKETARTFLQTWRL